MPNTKNNDLDQLAETLENTDGVEVVGHVDIANKSVQDVLVVKGSVDIEKVQDDKQSADTKEVVQEKAQEVAKAAKDTADDVIDKALDKQEQVAKKAEELKTAAQEKTEELKDELKDKAEQAAEVAGDIKEKAANLKDNAEDKLDELKDKAHDTAENIKETAQSAIAEAKEKFDAIKAEMEEKAQDLKADLQNKAQDIKSDAQLKAVELGEKAQEIVDNIKDKTDDVAQTAQDKAQAIAGDVERIQADATARAQNSKGILAKIGAYFAGSSAAKNEHFQSVDLDSNEFQEDAFRAQAANVSSQLFGGKLATAQSLVGKIAPNANNGTISNAIFDKLAAWANAWAKKDLLKDSRFKKLATLTDLERDDFARDVANQNRALAVVGGFAGLFGVKGVIADSAWLLMVSLKSVYQLALIYDKPLTGKDGIRLAYGVLSGANLSKLQEKQVILTALALGNAFFINAQDSSLKQELEKVGLKYRTGDTFAKQLDDLSNFIDIDKLNASWLRRLLPVSSVAVGSYYNRELIDEVLGTAMATFRPERPELLTNQGFNAK